MFEQSEEHTAKFCSAKFGGVCSTQFEHILGGVPYQTWRVVVDESRTLQLPEIQLLIKIYRKRSIGWKISLDEPIFNKPEKSKEQKNSEPYYDYVI